MKGKIVLAEKDFGSLYNGNTVVALIRGISMVTCIEIWKRCLVQRDILVQQNPKAFQPVLKSFRSEFKSISFESEAEKLSSEMYIKKSFIVKKRKATKPQTDDNLLQSWQEI